MAVYAHTGAHMTDAPPADVESILRANIKLLMKQRRLKQKDVARLAQRSQGWISKRLSGKPSRESGSRFQVQDLDVLANVFGLSPTTLLQPLHGNSDRRHADKDRRSGFDRRNNQWLGWPGPTRPDV